MNKEVTKISNKDQKKKSIKKKQFFLKSKKKERKERRDLKKSHTKQKIKNK